MSMIHIPVMLKEVIDNLQVKKGDFCIDGTLGAMGYTSQLLKEVGKEGKVLSLDLDEKAIAEANKIKIDKNLDNLIIEHSNFKNIKEVVEKHFSLQQKFNCIVVDLGLSSDQLRDEERSFSFQSDAPLDMAFSREELNDTQRIVNSYSQKELERIIKDYGEERFAKSISSNIVKARKEKAIKTGKDLQNLIAKTVPTRFWPKNVNVATKTFQALRIATNKELQNLEEFLPQAIELLKPQGRLAVLSFHSLEDAIVKHYFKKEAKDCICPPEIPICVCGHKAKIQIIKPKGITASEEELKINPRARSARLRIVEKI
ncbi:MAG TPA: 16S rRNA (cytosine(1402)-N(4))-methyltransferase RsmH [Patescibacteria group bacterium]|nr:16S rRNA (cytosine(1402)-N(4))-methyltransferase RsmH [Patescibacteria group bacterium]